MPIAKKVIKHLDENKVTYDIIEHRTVFTAFDAAATMKRDLREVMKILLIKTDKPLYGWQKGFVLVALAAHRNIDFKKLLKAVNTYNTKATPKAEKVVRAKKVSIPKENVMAKVFKVKPGGLHAFGSLFKVPVFIDTSITAAKKIVVPTGTYTESFEMTPKAFMDIEGAIKASFSVVKKIKKPKNTKSRKHKNKKPQKR